MVSYLSGEACFLGAVVLKGRISCPRASLSLVSHRCVTGTPLLVSHGRCWAHAPGVAGYEEVTAGRPCALLPRSRTKNMMWYGVLGTRELLHRTYKNLEQKVLLEVSGQHPQPCS